MALSVSFIRGRRWNSFTLIELLVVILIIAILAALTMAASEAVMNKGARTRAQAEIQGMSAALEAYKTDAGAFPWTNIPGQVSFASTADYTSVDCSSPGGFYMVSAQIVYEALSGKTNFSDTPIAGTTKMYMPLKSNQVGNLNATGYSASSSTYMQDPWGYPYGYYTSPTSGATAPYNGANQIDLWSTAGLLKSTSSSTPGWTNTWINNWTPQ
jgi:prepilin-type N-terminal cleavage/methylation domain-containing protein